MTRIFGLVDPDPERRRRLLAGVGQRFDAKDGLRTTRWEHGDLKVLASVGETAPVDQASDQGGGAWVLGTIYGGDGEHPATHVLRQLGRRGAAGINGLNGYYLACTVEPSGAIALGTDVLGFFPLYFWASREVLVFATDPGLVRLHPDCPGGLSLEGLAGILLQGHEANGQSIWQGVCRPDAGHVLQWRPGSAATTASANPLVPGDAGFGIAYAAARQSFSETLQDAVARSVGSGLRAGLMLSGGLDSRLVAGCLSRIGLGGTTAFTFGDSTDIEVECAAAVARRLKVPMIRVPIDFNSFADLAAERIAEEQLSNTLWDFGWLSGVDVLKAHGRPLLSGLFGDAVAGGSTVGWAYDPRRGIYSFDTLFAKITARGLSAPEISQLVPGEKMARAVHDVVEQLRSRYDALPGLPFQKSWLWGLSNRNRYHVAAYPWRLSSASWPLMPYADRQMLELAATMPLNFLGQRRIEVDTLRQEFLPLARLPLDRNSLDTSPLYSSRFGRLRSRVSAKVSRLFGTRKERRAYYRVFDINNRGWRAVRELAERSRRRAHDLVQAEALARWVPQPEVAIDADDAIIDTANRKNLLALMIFAGQEPDVMIFSGNAGPEAGNRG